MIFGKNGDFGSPDDFLTALTITPEFFVLNPILSDLAILCRLGL